MFSESSMIGEVRWLDLVVFVSMKSTMIHSWVYHGISLKTMTLAVYQTEILFFSILSHECPMKCPIHCPKCPMTFEHFPMNVP